MVTRIWTVVVLGIGVASVAEAAGDAVNRGLASRMTCEAVFAGADGDNTLRNELLENALRVAPDYAPAHWARGEMQVGDEWKPIVDIQAEASSDPKIAEYLKLRQTIAGAPAAQLELAQWCQRNDLVDEARFHWLQVLAADRNHQQALRALDSEWVGGQLLPSDLAEEVLAEQRSLRKVNADWRTRIAGWQRALAAGGDKAARALAEVEAVVDESAIPEFERLVGDRMGRYPADIERSVQLCQSYISALSRLPSYEASLAICRIAVLANNTSLRDVATEALRQRPTYEVVPVLITSLSPLIESRFEISRSENGRLNHYHEFVAEGADADYVAESSTSVNIPVIVQIGSRPEAIWNARLRAERRSYAASQQLYRQAMRLEQMAEAANTNRELLNERIVGVLRSVTGQDFDYDPKKWWDYWREYNGYEETRETVAYRTSRRYHTPEVTKLPPSLRPKGGGTSCFAAGTLVWTKTGTQAIETLTAGDLVLTMDELTGERCFRPVLERTLRDPSPLIRVSTENYQLLATPGHPFWVEGVGWQMTKELEPGDRILSAHGSPIEISGVSSAGVEEEAFNLVVEGNSNYFVGPDGLLAHDNTQRRPELTRAGQQ